MPLVQPKTVVGGISMSVTNVLNAENEIPVYQRGLCVTEKASRQLWNDIIDPFDLLGRYDTA